MLDKEKQGYACSHELEKGDQGKASGKDLSERMRRQEALG